MRSPVGYLKGLLRSNLGRDYEKTGEEGVSGEERERRGEKEGNIEQKREREINREMLRR